MVKKAVKLPKRTLSSFLHTSNRHGGLGLQSLEDILHTTRIARCVSCLASRDKRVRDISWSQLSAVVRRRRGLSEITIDDVTDFLNNPPLPHEAVRGDVRSLWSIMRKSLQYLDCKLSFHGTEVSVVRDDMEVGARENQRVHKLLGMARDAVTAKSQSQTRIRVKEARLYR